MVSCARHCPYCSWLKINYRVITLRAHSHTHAHAHKYIAQHFAISSYHRLLLLSFLMEASNEIQLKLLAEHLIQPICWDFQPNNELDESN